jgi:hypothetical protein
VRRFSEVLGNVSLNGRRCGAAEPDDPALGSRRVAPALSTVTHGLRAGDFASSGTTRHCCGPEELDGLAPPTAPRPFESLPILLSHFDGVLHKMPDQVLLGVVEAIHGNISSA